jgi:thymidylate synthase
MAAQIGVEPGEYMHIADSFHIYGSYFNEFEGFLKMTQTRNLEDRVLSTNGFIPGTQERVIDLMIEGLDKLLSEPDMPEAKTSLVRARKEKLAGMIL